MDSTQSLPRYEATVTSEKNMSTSGHDSDTSPTSSGPGSESGDTATDLVVVKFEPGDPINPYNWTPSKKVYIVLTGTITSINATMGSSLTSNMIPQLQSAFHIPSGPQTVLPASVFLIGFVLGPLIFAPLSEQYGRRPILVLSGIIYTLFTLASALAPESSWAAFLIFRLFAGVFGAPPMSVTGGAIADVYDDPTQRGRMNMYWTVATMIGPLFAPLISGFSAPHGWRITFWVALGISFLSSVFALFLPETLGTKILRGRATEMNEAKHTDRYICAADLDRRSVLATLATTITRPVTLFCREAIVFLTCVYMAFVYAVFFMLLEIFPAVFEDIYGFSPGLDGVAFLMMDVGAVLAVLAGLLFERFAPGLRARHPHKSAEYARLPLACMGGPAFVVSLLWMGWSARKSVHWVVPLLSMVPYGFAYQTIFMAIINYLADAYGVWAASAIAACATTRSILGAVIPLAVSSMLERLGVAWSCTVLALISAALAGVPFAFIVWGHEIRARSRFASMVGAKEDAGEEPALARSLSAV